MPLFELLKYTVMFESVILMFWLIIDVDDKIIKRGRNEHLFGVYMEETKDLKKITSDVASALDLYVQETLNTTDPDKKTMREKILTSVRSTMEEVGKQIDGDSETTEKHREKLLYGAKDVLFEWLDGNRPKGQVFENDVFAKFARGWEDEYFKDMKALNVLPPDVLTRVSEYVPEIVAYIEKIIENGYGYESNGSVYFNVVAFRESPKHNYAKLVPEAVGDLKALQEGEGTWLKMNKWTTIIDHGLLMYHWQFRRAYFGPGHWEEIPCRFCIMENIQTWRTELGFAMGKR